MLFSSLLSVLPESWVSLVVAARESTTDTKITCAFSRITWAMRYLCVIICGMSIWLIHPIFGEVALLALLTISCDGGGSAPKYFSTILRSQLSSLLKIELLSGRVNFGGCNSSSDFKSNIVSTFILLGLS